MEPRVVLHYRSEFLAGTETFIARQLEALESGGRFSPMVLCRSVISPRDPVSPHAVPVPIRPGNESREMESRMRGLSALAAGRVRRTLGLPPGGLQLSRTVLESIRERGPCLIHAHFGGGGWDMLETAAALDLPLVVTFYGWDVSYLPRRRGWRRAYARVFERAALCLGEGSHMLRTLEELGCPPAKLRLVRNPVSTEFIPFRERRWVDARTERLNLLFVGRLVEKKGAILAVRALARLRRDYPGLHLNLVGDGPRRREIEHEVLAQGLSGAVTLHGSLPYPEMARLLHHSDALLVPSLTARDGDTEGGAPNILLDGQASGIPIVGTDHCDIPEFVAPGLSTLLAPEGDQAEFTNSVHRLLQMDRPGAWEEMGRAGREHVRKTFDTPVVLEALHGIYDEVTRRGARPCPELQLSA